MKYAVSFFSGALGLDLGLERAGFTTLAYCEKDAAAQATIRANRPHAILFDDITTLTPDAIFARVNATRDGASQLSASDIFLICGGPPCQSFSGAGKRAGFADARGSLLLRYLELACAIAPQYILLENVRGILSCTAPRSTRVPSAHSLHNPGEQNTSSLHTSEADASAVDFVARFFRERNYTVSFNLYNTANYGVPQCRERFILIAHKQVPPAPPNPVPYMYPTHEQHPPTQNLRGGAERSPAQGGTQSRLLPWVTLGEALSRIDPATVHEHLPLRADAARFLRQLSAGQNWRNLPLDQQRAAMGNTNLDRGGCTGFYRRLALDRPCPTLVTSPTMRATSLTHPTADRPLSVQEYAAIQTFPPDFTICASSSESPPSAKSTAEKYRQLGNAVPVLFAHAIGRTILAHHTNTSPAPLKKFAYSRYKHTSDRDHAKKKIKK